MDNVDGAFASARGERGDDQSTLLAGFLGGEILDPELAWTTVIKLVQELDVGKGSHVDQLLRQFLLDRNLSSQTDEQIWEFARNEGCTSILRDSKFRSWAIDDRNLLAASTIVEAINLCRMSDFESSKDCIPDLRFLFPAIARDLLIPELATKIVMHKKTLTQVLYAGARSKPAHPLDGKN